MRRAVTILGFAAVPSVQGILAWRDHCMEILADSTVDRYLGRPDIADAVNAYVI